MQKNWILSLSGALATVVCLSGVTSKADRFTKLSRPGGESRFTLEYYANRGNPMGGTVDYANASGEICESGEVVISVKNPTYEYNGRQYPIHGDEQNNAANLLCKVKGLDYAQNVMKAESSGKVLTLEAHGNTFELDGHHTTVTAVECYARVQEPCKSFNKNMLGNR